MNRSRICLFHSKMEVDASTITMHRPEIESYALTSYCSSDTDTASDDAMEIGESDDNNYCNCCTLQYCQANVDHPTPLDAIRPGIKCEFPYCDSSRLIAIMQFCSNNRIRDRSNLKRKSLSSEDSDSDSDSDDMTKGRHVDTNNNIEPNPLHLPINTATSGNFNKVWSGSLKWHKRAKTINNSEEHQQPKLQIIPFEVSVYSSNHKKFVTNNISTPMNHGSDSMKLIPTAILSRCGLLRHVYTVLFKFDELLLDDVNGDDYYEHELKEILKAGRYAGYVHFEVDEEQQENALVESGKNYPIKILFLQ